IPVPAPGMAAAKAPDGKPQPFQYAMLPECFHCILGTGRCKPAFGTQYRGYDPLIQFDQCNERETKYLRYALHVFALVVYLKLHPSFHAARGIAAFLFLYK